MTPGRDNIGWSRARSVVAFVVVPIAVSAVLMALYFSGVRWMQQIVAPHVEDVYRGTGREFGALENLQLFFLLAVSALAFTGVLTKPRWWERLVLLLVGLAATWVFLEEIDYGVHFTDLLLGVRVELGDHVRNLHNVGGRASLLSHAGEALTILFFVIFPVAAYRSRYRLVQYIRPSAWFVALSVLMPVISQTAHAVEDAGFNPEGALRGNISEFREMLFYYALALYAYRFVLHKRWGGAPGLEGEHGC